MAGSGTRSSKVVEFDWAKRKGKESSRKVEWHQQGREQVQDMCGNQIDGRRVCARALGPDGRRRWMSPLTHTLQSGTTQPLKTEMNPWGTGGKLSTPIYAYFFSLSFSFVCFVTKIIYYWTRTHIQFISNIYILGGSQRFCHWGTAKILEITAFAKGSLL